MKRTAEDDAFVRQFAGELRIKYDEAKSQGVTDETFADSIGVMRPQLGRYLAGEAMPGVRTVAFAYAKYGIGVPYAGISFHQSLKHTKKRLLTDERSQLTLPFRILAQTPGEIDMKIRPVSAHRFELKLSLKR